MRVHLLTFTNLYPSSRRPHHGLFIQERVTRLAQRNGWRLTVVSPLPLYPPLPGARGWVPRTELVGGVAVHHPRYLHLPGLGVPWQWRAMALGAKRVVARLARSDGVPVLDAHYLYPDGCAAVAIGRRLGLPCIVTARGSDLTLLPERPAIAAALRRQMPLADRCLAVSRDLASRLASLTGIPREEVMVVSSGVDLDRFRPGDRAAARKALGIGAEEKVLLSVTRLDPVKGLDRLLEAFSLLQGGGLRLVLVGGGPEEARLRALAGRLGVRERVRFAGELAPELCALAYQAADLFVLASRREGWPNVVMEALASGLPVVARAVGGIPEMLEGSGGTLVEGEGAEPLARALAARLAAPGDPGLSRRRAEELGWESTLERLSRVVEEVAACRP